MFMLARVSSVLGEVSVCLPMACLVICANRRSHDKSLVVAADDTGNIKLFRYPVLSKQVGAVGMRLR